MIAWDGSAARGDRRLGGLLLTTMLLLPARGAAQAAADSGYAGRPLAQVIHSLQSRGLTVLFTAELVRPELRVLREPVASEPRRILDEILAPHRLTAREEPGGVLVIVAAPRAPDPGRATIEGEVLALGGRQSVVPGARVRVLEPAVAAHVGEDGRFSITLEKPGRYTLEASGDGYLDQRMDLMVDAGKTRRVDFRLQPQPFLLEELVVRPSRLSPLEARPESEFSWSRDQIESVPQLGGDVFRAASLLPGTTANDVTAQFSVHGGRRDEVKVVLDGQELYEAYHLEDYDNALSIVPARALAEANLSTGGYSASYGDRMSGVLDLRTAEPQARRHYLASASVIDVMGSGSGSLGGDGRGRWFVTGRRASTDLASPLIGKEDPTFWDTLGKIEVDTHAGLLAGRVLVADDSLEFSSFDADGTEQHQNDYRSGYGWITHQVAPSDHLLIETAASWSGVHRHRFGSADEEKGAFMVQDRRDLEALGLSSSWSLDRGGRNQALWGWELHRYDADFDYSKRLDPSFVILAPFSPPRANEHTFDGTLRGDHAGAWASDRIQMFDRLTAELGMRWDRHEATDDTLWSPRVNLAWRIDDRNLVRASWGHFFQSQRPYELEVEDGETSLFPAEMSEYSLLGYESTFGRRVGLQAVRVELFRRNVDDPRPRYENLLEPINFLPETEPDRVRIAPDSSTAQGIEVMVRGRGGDRLGGWLAYSYERSQDSFGGNTVPRSLDQPSTLTLGLDYRPSRRWSLGFAWRYRSGWPTTPVHTILVADPDDPGEVVSQPVFGRLNSDRLPAYHRLDLRASRRFDLGRGALQLFIDIQNLYNRKNQAGLAVTVDQDTDLVTRERESWPGLFPSLGVAWEF